MQECMLSGSSSTVQEREFEPADRKVEEDLPFVFHLDLCSRIYLMGRVQTSQNIVLTWPLKIKTNGLFF